MIGTVSRSRNSMEVTTRPGQNTIAVATFVIPPLRCENAARFSTVDRRHGRVDPMGPTQKLFSKLYVGSSPQSPPWPPSACSRPAGS